LPHLGIFAQTDPIGQTAGPNLYAYVGGDPVNLVDPTGLDSNDVTVTHLPCIGGAFHNGICTASNPSTPTPQVAGGPGEQRGGIVNPNPIVITCDRACRARILLRRLAGRLAGRLAAGLDSLANWIGPGEQKKPGETTSDCIARVAGADPALAISGAAGVAAGGAFLGYPRVPFAGGGGGTSLISSGARGAFGRATMGGGSLFGTGLVGGAVGRFTSVLSAGTGAAILGHAAGHGVGAIQVCTR
jgi:hypothetical protein